jgi:membrane fusion protein (multidrug efflux system)
VKAEQSDVPLTAEWVGTLDGYVNAQIQPQANGYLIRQNYREGSQVVKGQILFEIDPRPFEAALHQAQGTLGQAQAQLGLAEINLNRDTPLAAQRAIAQKTRTPEHFSSTAKELYSTVLNATHLSKE